MVDVLGHLASVLLATVPVWVRWRDRPALSFIGLALVAALVPDIDMYLPWVTHHGVTHTLLFVGTVALAGAAVAAVAAPKRFARWSPGEPTRATHRTLFGFVFAALLLGGSVHLLMDMLSTAASQRAIHPFWPVAEKPFSVYVIHSFSTPTWNSLPFLLAVIFHAVVARATGRQETTA